jgi:hypothetical protein
MATAEQKQSPFAGLKAELAGQKAQHACENIKCTYGDTGASDAEVPAEIHVNFYPAAVHVFTSAEAAQEDSDRFANANFARPTSGHYKRVE